VIVNPNVPAIGYLPTVPAILRRAARSFGDSDYIVMPDRRICFRDAEAASRRLSKELLAAGIGKGGHVGIHLPTGPEWVVAFLAVTRIGAVAMPLSTLYRPAELCTALRVGDVSLLLSAPVIVGKDHQAFLESAIPGLDAAVAGRLRIPQAPHLRSIWLLNGGSTTWARSFSLRAADADGEVDGIDDLLLEAVETEVSPADPMTVIFTSGTTAAPKAVIHSQGTIVRKTARSANAALRCIFGGRVLCLMPFFWIGGIQEVVAALQSGAAVLTIERSEAAAALELGKREWATTISGNPQALRSLFGDADLESAVPSLQPFAARPWDGGPSSRGHMATGIGLTETFGPWSNVAGMQCRIVDPNTSSDVAEGEVGEFWIRGYGLMLGLYKREREEVFTPDGFYRTGDLGYIENGLYFFSARLKDMIKTKGANVAPAEVEVVLNADPAVRMSFVSGAPHPRYGEEVVAAVMPEDGRPVDVERLFAQCRRALSSYKVPTMIEVLDPIDIPYLASGKPDRKSIKELLIQRHTAGQA